MKGREKTPEQRLGIPENEFVCPPEQTKGRRINITRKTKIVFGLTALMVVGAVVLFSSAIGSGASALAESYKTASDAERESAYRELYDKYYERAEQEYHVSNRVSISIGNLKETATLEVLQVRDIEYIIEDRSENNKGISSWLEVPGQGVFVVNLQAAEFVVDNERSYVLVRAPYPELTNISIDSKNVKTLFFDVNGIFDSYQDGTALAEKQVKLAEAKIQRELAKNQYFYLNAQDAAVASIQCLVQQLNPEVENLTVEVEFF